MPMKRSEIELGALMNGAQKGDAAAYRCLLERLSRLLRRYFTGRLARMGRGGAEAEDLVQEVLIAIHTRRHTYDPAQPFTPWVYAIARYKLVDHVRRASAAMSHIPLEAAAEVPANDVRAASESGLDLDRLLAKLPATSRLVIQDMKLHGLSVAETARRHGLTESAVKVRIHRGLKALALAIKRER